METISDLDTDVPVPVEDNPVPSVIETGPYVPAPEWHGGQMINAQLMKKYLRDPVGVMTSPPFFRANHMINTHIVNDAENIAWDNADIRNGFTTTDRVFFRATVSGMYWVNCFVGVQTPLREDAYESVRGKLDVVSRHTESKGEPPVIATVLLRIYRNPPLPSGDQVVLKGYTSTRVANSWTTVQTSGLVSMGAGMTIRAMINGNNGVWGQPQTGLTKAATSAFSAVLISPSQLNM